MSLPPPTRCRRSFSLRRLMLAFVVLGVVCAACRGWRERAFLQEEAIHELHALGCEFVYGAQETVVSRPQLSRLDVWELMAPQAADQVTHVNLRVPFRSADDARQANSLLRRLPHLRRVSILPASSPADGLDARSHAGIALRGLALD